MPRPRDPEYEAIAEQVLSRIRDEPTSFPAMIEDGIIPDRETATVVRSYLERDGLIARAGFARDGKPARPRRIYEAL